MTSLLSIKPNSRTTTPTEHTLSSDITNKCYQLTNEYQRQAAAFLSTTYKDNEKIHLFSRHFALAALDNNNSTAQYSNEPLQNVAGNSFICRYCGTLLFSGHLNTTVRIKSTKDSTATLRRKRIKAAQKRKQDQISTISTTTITTNTTNTTTNTNTASEHNNKMYQVTQVKDGECVNYVTYKCGNCANETQFKGVTVAAKHRTIQKRKLDRMAQQNTSVQIAKAKSSLQQTSQPAPPPSCYKQENKTFSFLSIRKQTNPHSTSKPANSSPSDMTHFLSKKRNKKEKKGNPPKKSKLMNFLSSLND